MAYLATNIFNADGVTTQWDFVFAGVSPDSDSGTTPYLYASDVKALELYRDIDGNAAAAERIVTINPLLPNRAIINGPAIAAGRQVKIYRSTEIRFPLVDYRDRQSVSERDLDLANRQAIFVAQETQDAASNNMALDKNDNYDVKNRRIVNLAQGVDDSDAVNMAQYRRSIRVSGNDNVVSVLPLAGERAGKLLSFDLLGNPITVHPPAGTALDLEMRLASGTAGNGADMIAFWQDHANAVVRTMRHKMRDIKGILDYAAPGFPVIDPTGVLDSTAGVNAAHAAADLTNSQLFYSDGDFRVTDTVKARSHTLFSRGARLMHYGFPDDKAVYEIPGDKPGRSHMYVQVVAGLGDFETPASYSGRGIVVASREGNPNTFGAYNTGIYFPKVRFCAHGLIIRSFQQVVMSPDISDCRTGVSIAGTSGSNEAGVINVFGGWIRNCNDYAAYIGDPRILPVTTNSFNGTTINFHGTQFLGSVRATKVAALAFPHCHFENHGYGDGTALLLDAGCYNVFADHCYFGGYDYNVRCNAQVSGVLSVMRATVFGCRKGHVYFLQPPGRLYADTPVYTGGTNHDKAPAFHFGMAQVSSTEIASLFRYIDWSGIGFNVVAGVQAGCALPDHALPLASRRETNGEYINIGVAGATGFYSGAPVSGIAGTLGAAGTAIYKVKLTNPADARHFGAGWNVSCSGGAEGATTNVITNVDYELGIISLSLAYSPTPLAVTISHTPAVWVKRRVIGNFTAANTPTYTVNDVNTVSAGNITLRPRNAPAARLTGGTKGVFVSSAVAGVSFTISTSDGSALGADAPNWSYEMINV